MIEITHNQLLLVGTIFLSITAVQLLISISTLIALSRSKKSQKKLNLEVYGLLKKIEGLSASRRDKIVKRSRNSNYERRNFWKSMY